MNKETAILQGLQIKIFYAEALDFFLKSRAFENLYSDDTRRTHSTSFLLLMLSFHCYESSESAPLSLF